MKTIVVEVSTLYGFLFTRTILDQLNFEVEAYLLVSNNGPKPETDGDMFEKIVELNKKDEKFSNVVYLNDLIFPYHPRKLKKEGSLLGSELLKKSICPVEPEFVLTQSIQAPPASFLVELFSFSKIMIYADGLQVFSPTRVDLPDKVLKRICNVFYVDLLRQTTPLLLKEAEPLYEVVSKENIIKTCETFQKNLNVELIEGKSVLILGQYLTELGFVSAETEELWYKEIIKKLYKENGDDYVYIFKPHPGCSPEISRKLVSCLKDDGIQVKLDSSRLPVEIIGKRVSKVSGIFSTGILSLQYLYGVEPSSFYTEELFNKIEPFKNSNRIPVLICNYQCDKSSLLKEYFSLNLLLELFSFANYYGRFKKLYGEEYILVVLNKINALIKDRENEFKILRKALNLLGSQIYSEKKNIEYVNKFFNSRKEFELPEVSKHPFENVFVYFTTLKNKKKYQKYLRNREQYFKDAKFGKWFLKS